MSADQSNNPASTPEVDSLLNQPGVALIDPTHIGEITGWLLAQGDTIPVGGVQVDRGVFIAELGRNLNQPVRPEGVGASTIVDVMQDYRKATQEESDRIGGSAVPVGAATFLSDTFVQGGRVETVAKLPELDGYQQVGWLLAQSGKDFIPGSEVDPAVMISVIENIRGATTTEMLRQAASAIASDDVLYPAIRNYIHERAQELGVARPVAEQDIGLDGARVRERALGRLSTGAVSSDQLDPIEHRRQTIAPPTDPTTR